MATSEVSKYSVYDPRVVQTKPKYAVEKGALSLTNVTFNAQTANQTAQQFNVIVPSENVFIDRAVEWISGGVIQVPITLAGAVSAGQVLLSPTEVAFAAFPSHQCVAQMTATINDATVTVNTQDVLNYVLRLQDLAKHRRQRTCPTMLDTYAVNPSSAKENSPLNGYAFRFEADEEPNGAFGQWWFADATGAPLTTNSGLPVTTAQAGASTQNVYIRWQSSEHLLLPPFIFGDAYELSTGLFGVQNFQVQMNMSASPARAIRIASSVPGRTVGSVNTTTTISSVGAPVWATGVAGSYAPYPLQPALSVQFLTPALDVPLPPKSIVPYMEFPRYITTGIPVIASTLGKVSTSAKNISASGGASISSNTITLPNIPDLLMVYLKPSTPGVTTFSTEPSSGVGVTWSPFIGDFTLPIEGVSINFDNFSGLLANHTQYQLYKMSVNNGLDMDFAQWAGQARDLAAGASTVTSAGEATTKSAYISTAGGPLVLRPGRDFALQAGQAPGLVGNFTLQLQLQVGNQFASEIAAGGVQLYVVPISSGFFETIKGSSRIIKGVLTEQDILSAPPHAPEEALMRKVGGKSKGHMSADAMVSQYTH